MRRTLSTSARLRIFTDAHGECSICHGKITVGERWEVSHEIPLAMGGSDTPDNMRPAHFKCHRDYTASVDVPAIARAKRIEARHVGAKATKRPMPGSRDSQWKRRMDGTVVRRDR